MTADLGDLTLGADQPATGRMLIAQKRCCAICLFAIDQESAHCACNCKGTWHGALSYLLDQVVDGAPRRVTTAHAPGEHPDQLAAFDPHLPEPEPAGAVT